MIYLFENSLTFFIFKFRTQKYKYAYIFQTKQIIENFPKLTSICQYSMELIFNDIQPGGFQTLILIGGRGGGVPYSIFQIGKRSYQEDCSSTPLNCRNHLEIKQCISTIVYCFSFIQCTTNIGHKYSRYKCVTIIYSTLSVFLKIVSMKQGYTYKKRLQFYSVCLILHVHELVFRFSFFRFRFRFFVFRLRRILILRNSI